MLLDDQRKSFQQRKTFSLLKERFCDEANALDRRVDAYANLLQRARNGELGSIPKNQQTAEHFTKAITELDDEVQNARKELAAVAELKREGWVAKDGIGNSELKSALGTYKEKVDKFHGFLGGEKYEITANDLPGRIHQADGSYKQGLVTGPKSVEVDPKLKAAFQDAQTAVKDVQGIMDGTFGHLRVNGITRWEGITNTVKQNYEESKFWEKGFKGKPLQVAFRGGALVAAGAAIGDSLLRSTDREGEDRSKLVRCTELLAGVGAGGAALLAHKAL